MHIVDKNESYENIRVKYNTKLWFDKDVSHFISMRDKQKKIIKSKLHVDFELYKEYRKLALSKKEKNWLY